MLSELDKIICLLFPVLAEAQRAVDMLTRLSKESRQRDVGLGAEKDAMDGAHKNSFASLNRPGKTLKSVPGTL